jgi:hypothetical protein
VEFFEQLVLPFGSRAAVPSFNWVARGILYIMVVLFGLTATHYFDDFSVLELDCLATDTQKLVDDLLDLLGWETKEQKPFAKRFDVLGVVCDLSMAASGKVVFANKQSRIDEVASAAEAFVKRGILLQAEARSFRGRFVFASGQTFGRCGAVPLRALGQYADGPRRTPLLDTSMCYVLDWIADFMRTARPRDIRCFDRPSLVLLTDGACEKVDGRIVASIGAVLFDPESSAFLYFGLEVPDDVTALWMQGSREQLIAQAELLPILLARTTWHSVMAGRLNVTFVDNDGARFSMIRGFSSVLDNARIIGQVWMADAVHSMFSWYARVPSAANLADAPSRLDFAYLESLPNSSRSQPCVPAAWGPCLWSGVRNVLSSERLLKWEAGLGEA